MSDVTSLDERRPASNLRCSCGSEWWVTAVVLDAAERTVGGYATPLACSTCGLTEAGEKVALTDVRAPGSALDRARAAALRWAVEQVQTEARWQEALSRRGWPPPSQDIRDRLQVLEQILLDAAAQLDQEAP